MTQEIPLTKGMVAIVDTADFDFLSRFNWYAHKSNRTYYAARRATDAEHAPGQSRHIFMHQVLCGRGCDHIDRNGLNNTRGNLRPATKSQNSVNCRKVNRKTGYRGVSINGRWGYQATVNFGGSRHRAGTFKTKVEAAIAYDRLAKQLHGEFAVLNFPDGEAA